MSSIEFQPWPKISRLNRDIIVTEKLDGTNAAVVIVPASSLDHIIEDESNEYRLFDEDTKKAVEFYDGYVIFAQSRTRFITPGNDNYGFAAWVARNAAALVDALGEGTHYGEWWGSGIQRKYGLTGGDRVFSLFNTSRWSDTEFDVPGLEVVPKLYEGPFDQNAIDLALELLRTYGSIAAAGFARPEGIVVFHTAAREMFKVTLEGDEKPKGPDGHKFDEEVTA